MNVLINLFQTLLLLGIFLSSTLAGATYKQYQYEKLSSNAETRILKTLRTNLPRRYFHQAMPIMKTIIDEAQTHNIDPLLITAIISGESSFNPNAIGPVGEIGLMQLRSSTASWIAQKAKIPWMGKSSLTNPNYNIRIGVAYLSYLKLRFSPKGGLLYLTAYNMGETTLSKLLSKKIEPYVYKNHVMKNYIAIN